MPRHSIGDEIVIFVDQQRPPILRFKTNDTTPGNASRLVAKSAPNVSSILLAHSSPTMASTAMQGRRRELTYGKRASRGPGPGFSNGFETLSIGTPRKSPSRLARVQASPGSFLYANSVPAKEDRVYDVPSSDDEDSEPVPPSSPTPKRTQKSKVASRIVEPAKAKPLPAATVYGSPQKASINEKKRKRQSPAPNAGTSVSHHEKVKTNGVSSASYAKPTRTMFTTIRATAGVASMPTEHQDQAASASDRQKVKPAQKTYQAKPSLASDTTPLPLPIANPTFDESLPSLDEDDEEDHVPSKIHESSGDPHPSTPPQHRSGSTPSSNKALTTPRQAKIWGDLFNDEEVRPMRPLKQTASQPGVRESNQRDKVVRPTRSRLIDSLQASLQSSDPVEPTELESEFTEDVQMLKAETDSQGPSQELKPADASHVLASQLNTSSIAGPRITYAQQRSYLQDADQSLDALLSQPLDIGVPASTAIGRTTFGGHGLGHISDDEDDGGGAMKTIHEMRAAGDTRRFDDEMDTLLDDVGTRTKAGLSGKRSALMELMKRLCDLKFKRRFVERSFDQMVFEKCKNEVDPICGTAIAFAGILLLKEPMNSRTVFQLWEAGLVETLLAMFDHIKDIRTIAKERKSNMARIAQGAVTEMVAAADLTEIWQWDQPNVVSPCMVSILALDLLVRGLREVNVTESLLDAMALKKLMGILSTATRTLIKGQTAAFSDALISSRVVLSAMESWTVAPACAQDRALWTPNTLEALVHCLETMLDPSLDLSSTTALTLRLCVNLANNSETNSESFAVSGFIGRLMERILDGFRLLPETMANEDRQSDFDELVLGLGALFNLAEMSELARHLIPDQHPEVLAELLGVFHESRQKFQEADSMAATRANVVFGYLAVLLGNVCLDLNGRRVVQAHLPGYRLVTIIEAIEEFIQHHKAVDREGSNELWAGFTNRLQTVVETLKAVEAS